MVAMTIPPYNLLLSIKSYLKMREHCKRNLVKRLLMSLMFYDIETGPLVKNLVKKVYFSITSNVNCSAEMDQRGLLIL